MNKYFSLISKFARIGLMTLGLVSPVFGQEPANQQTTADWPDYQAVGQLNGNLTSVGSDSLANLVLLWAETFKTLYPAVDIQIESTGSATAPPALALGEHHIGPMSRLMNEQEIQDFMNKLGYKPTPFVVAIDALAVLVHPDNPLTGLSLRQLARIFSESDNCDSGEEISRWAQLGLTGEWSSQPIELFGRNSNSGTYEHFKHHVLCDGEFRPDLSEMPGSASVVQALSQNRNGIAYSALGYANERVRVLPLSRSAESNDPAAYVDATPDNAMNGSYPLARLLYIYVNHDPTKPWDPVLSEFIRMVLSPQGQEQVTRAAYAPLPFTVAKRELKKLLPAETMAKDES